MSAADNERVKYVANAFDRASTSSLTVGVFALIAAAIYAPASSVGNLWVLSIAGPCWLFTAGILHFVGRFILRRLL